MNALKSKKIPGINQVENTCVSRLFFDVARLYRSKEACKGSRWQLLVGVSSSSASEWV